MPWSEFETVDVPSVRGRRTLKWDGLDEETLAAGVAEMDFGIAPVIQQALIRDVRRGALGYPGPAAFSLVGEAFAERTRRRSGWPVDPDLVTVVTDVITGLRLALEALTNPGEDVLVMTPAYPPYFMAVEAAGRCTVPSAMVEQQGRYVFDEESMEGLARNVSALLLCNPHNPTGRCFSVAELTWLAELAERHNLAVIADEVHGDLVYEPRVHVPYGAVALPETRYVLLTSASKGFNMSGLRCAVAVASSPSVSRALNRHEFYVRPGVSRLGVTACLAAWQHGDAWLEGLMQYLQGLRKLLVRELSERLPEVSCVAPEATYLAWLDWERSGIDDPANVGLEAGVAVSPGSWFGSGWEHHTRVNFATSTSNLHLIVDRLALAAHRLGAVESAPS